MRPLLNIAIVAASLGLVLGAHAQSPAVDANPSGGAAPVRSARPARLCRQQATSNASAWACRTCTFVATSIRPPCCRTVMQSFRTAAPAGCSARRRMACRISCYRKGRTTSATAVRWLRSGPASSWNRRCRRLKAFKRQLLGCSATALTPAPPDSWLWRWQQCRRWTTPREQWRRLTGATLEALDALGARRTMRTRGQRRSAAVSSLPTAPM
jgi:hypothetical protein